MEIFVVINFFLTVFLLLKISSVERRVKKASQYSPQQADNSAQTKDVTVIVEQSQIASTKIEQAGVLLNDDSDNAFSKALAWFREDWLLKLGGVFILLAAGWFVTYAFMNNWIGETGRIVLGILAGSVFMTWGVLRMKNVMREGEVILAVGAVILVTSILAGQHKYGLYPDTVSLATTTFVAIVISAIAYINKREILALFGVLMIGISPLLAGYGSVSPNVTGLLTYLLCMTLGVIWLSKVTGWRSVTFLTVAVVTFYFAPYCMQYKNYIDFTTHSYPGRFLDMNKLAVDIDILRFFAVVFSIIFNMSSFATLLFEKKANKDDFPLVAVCAAFVAFSLFALSTPDLLPLKLAMLTIVYMGLAVGLAKMARYSYYVELYATVSILFLIYATIKAAKIDILPIAFSIEAIILTLFYKKTFDIPYPVVSVLLYGGSYFVTLIRIFDVGSNWPTTLGFISTVVSTYFPYALAKFAPQEPVSKANDVAEKLSIISGNVLSAFGFFYFAENVGKRAGASLSLIKLVRYSVFATVGSFAYFMSRAPGKHLLKYFFGLGFIAYVVAGLLLYEVWMMDITARIVIFFLIGLLFVSSIYFLKVYEKKN